MPTSWFKNPNLPGVKALANTVIEAARRGDIDGLIRLAEQHGPEILAQPNYSFRLPRNAAEEAELMAGSHPLYAAIQAGQTETVKLLVNSGTYPEAVLFFFYDRLDPFFGPERCDTNGMPPELIPTMKVLYEQCARLFVRRKEDEPLN